MIRDICEMLEFDAEAVAVFEETLKKIKSDKLLSAKLGEATEDYFYGNGEVHTALLGEIAEKTGIHEYTVHMAFLLHCAAPLKDRYKAEGLSDELYLDTMRDLRYKLDECRNMYGLWGTFVFSWFRRFYLVERFKLGRLQYERIPFQYSEYKGILKEGDTVYNCHIPSSGPLTEESVMASLKEAYSFFRDELKNGIMPVYCSSWLLYPPTVALYSEGSNLKKFYECFDIITTAEKPDNPDFWRMFYKEYTPEVLDAVTPRTSMQRAFLGYLKAGGTMGSGKGVILFDGEKIVR